MSTDLISKKDFEIILKPYSMSDSLEYEAKLRADCVYIRHWQFILSKGLKPDNGLRSEKDLKLVELLHSMEGFKRKCQRLCRLSRLLREFACLEQKLQILQEQKNAVNQSIVISEQSEDALSTAIAALTEPVNVPLHEKTLLSVKEAAAHTGLGEKKLRKISDSKKCDFVLWNGSKRMFKREQLDAYLVRREHSI